MPVTTPAPTPHCCQTGLHGSVTIPCSKLLNSFGCQQNKILGLCGGTEGLRGLAPVPSLAALSPAKVLASHAPPLLPLYSPTPHSHGFPPENPVQASSGFFTKPWFTTWAMPFVLGQLRSPVSEDRVGSGSSYSVLMTARLEKGDPRFLLGSL